MNATAKLHPDFARVSGFTSRKPRPNAEPELYQYITHDEAGFAPIFQEIKRGELVQYAIHPTTHALYATRLHDFSGTYSLLDTFAYVVEGLRQLPFKQTLTVGLVTDPKTWRKWLDERYSNNNSERTKRLEEAILSLTWLLRQPEGDILWLENISGELSHTAQQLIDLCLGKQLSSHYAKNLAKGCLEMAQQMLKGAYE